MKIAAGNHATEIKSLTFFPTLIPSTPTWHCIELQSRILLSPSQQQLENSPNQKSKQPQNQRWDGTVMQLPILIKKENKETLEIMDQQQAKYSRII